ncbi:MAG: hypothetical protein AB8I08_35385 [Sandaracinaceae bacterium]
MRPLGLLVLFLTACGPRAERVPEPSAPCERLGDRCTTPEGPLGVCNVTPGDCDEPPCLACISQH